jgi:hypothetical protein
LEVKTCASARILCFDLVDETKPEITRKHIFKKGVWRCDVICKPKRKEVNLHFAVFHEEIYGLCGSTSTVGVVRSRL